MNNIRYISCLLLAFMVSAQFSLAQPPQGGRRGGPAGERIPVQVKSPIINPDNTVTFNYRNDNAKDVKLNVQFSGVTQMNKDANGIWTATVGPAAADMYPYCFIVDGIKVMDPLNPDWFPNEGFKNSILDIRNLDEPLLHSAKNVPHGSVDYVSYWSESLGTWGRAIVYTPPFYDREKGKKYPVFYLISGTTDTEEVYFKVGRVNFILDNLIAEGKAEEMIVVLPYGNPAKYFPEGSDLRDKGDMFSNDLINDLMPYVEKNYRTINDRDHRAIGGFSRGGNQGLANGLNNIDKFSYLCSYSSFTTTNLPVYDDPEKLNNSLNLFWLGVGTDDFLYGSAVDYLNFLDSKGINNVKFFTHDKFGHTWMNAKCFLGETLPLLFRPGAKTETMEVTVVPRKEQQLTPALMGSLFSKPAVSPEYHPDGSVSFRIKAEDAAKVELECQMFNGTKPMIKDENGIWSITVKPEVPDIYPYAFIVDGTKIADPANVDIFPNEGFKYSLCDVRRKEAGVQDIQDVPHGKVSYRYYHSDTCGGIERPLLVYTPAGYTPSGKEKLPVLYLIHGMTDTYETWFKVGRMNNILDNLIAQGRAERMIVAMPYANPYIEMNASGLDKPYDAMDTDLVTREIMDEVIPFIENNYKVYTDPNHRAIAGFSLGGRQALACGLGNSDKFRYVAPFAPAIFGTEYKENFENGVYDSIDTIKKNLKLLWLGTGSDDFLIQVSRSLDSFLTENGVEHTFYNPGGGHTWMNCRDYLELTAEKLFK